MLYLCKNMLFMEFKKKIATSVHLQKKFLLNFLPKTLYIRAFISNSQHILHEFI